MRMKRHFLAATTAAILLGGNAVAQSGNSTTGSSMPIQVVFETPNLAERQTVKDLVAQLSAAGFRYIEIRRTFLGRARFVAYSTSEVREVVINPTTGEVLRDLSKPGTGKLPPQANPGAQTSGNGNNGNGNGNSGNGNNGNGNGNSGNGNNGNGNGNSGNGNNGNGNGNGNSGN